MIWSAFIIIIMNGRIKIAMYVDVFYVNEQKNNTKV